MFLGEYRHALDSKGRVTIPARFRGELHQGLIITRGYEICLVIYPVDPWLQLARKAASMPVASSAARAYTRLIFGSAFEAMLDSMGRILIPIFLREYATIRDEAVIVGINTCIELWRPDRWEEVVGSAMENLDQILIDVANMGV